MKILAILLLGTAFLVSCRKEEKTIDVTTTPLFVKVEAVHSTGEVVTTNIIYIK